MKQLKQYPVEIASLITGMQRSPHTIGMSPAQVYTYFNETQQYVLKIEPENIETINERKMLTWLQDKLPVPRVFEMIVRDEISYILMSVLPGEMACDKVWLAQEDFIIAALADGLKQLWQVDPTTCPVDESLAVKLAHVERRVREGLITKDWATSRAKDFASPEALVEYLYQNQPEEQLVLSHGDYCMPNVFVNEKGVTGFIDLGHTGLADAYQDIALGVRTMIHNFGDNRGAERFFAALGIEPDSEKINYYILLNELF